MKKALLVPNPTPPLLYGLPKVHKVNTPMRPVVSFISSPTYLLAKFLDRWFKAYIGFESPHSVLNSASLADVLKDVSLPPGTTLCSFDVVGLFPNRKLLLCSAWVSYLLMLIFLTTNFKNSSIC